MFVYTSFYSDKMVSLIINVSEYIPRPLLWIIVIILLPFAAIIDIVNHIRDRGWLWIIFAFFIGFLIACYVSSAPQGEPGAMTVAQRQSFLFKIMQKTLGRDVVWMIISGLRIWKNVLQTGANFFGWQVWAIQGIERALLY